MQRNISSKPKKVVIVGAGGHGKVIADIIVLSGDVVLGFLDDKFPSEFPNITILGKLKDIDHYKQEASFIVGIGDNQTRKKIMESMNVDLYTAIHPTAVIASDVRIGEGTVVMANAVINTGSKIGKGVIVNTAATVDHDCTISDYVHISPGVHLGGTVNIGSETWVGIGTVVSNNIDICEECVVGAGSLVIRNIFIPGTYLGNPIVKKELLMGIKKRIQEKSASGINWRCVTIIDEEILVHIFFQKTNEDPAFFTSDYKILQESEYQNWGKGIKVRFDRNNYGLNDPGKDHIHIYKKDTQLFAINRDGTGHDKTSQVQIPRGIADRLRRDYPDFIIPKNNFIESVESHQMEDVDEILYLLKLQ